jgi:hypothetical protein
MSAQILHLTTGDEAVLQYLGAAVVLQWRTLSDDVRRSILQQASSVGGLPPIEHLHDQMKALIERKRD